MQHLTDELPLVNNEVIECVEGRVCDVIQVLSLHFSVGI
jgi:hypothetical protein